MKVSALDKAIAALREQRKAPEAQLAAIELAVTALEQQKTWKPRLPAPKPRKAKKAAAGEPTT